MLVSLYLCGRLLYFVHGTAALKFLLLKFEKSLCCPLPMCLLYLDVEFGGCISGLRLPSDPLTATMYHLFGPCIIYLFLTSVSVVFPISLNQ